MIDIYCGMYNAAATREQKMSVIARAWNHSQQDVLEAIAKDKDRCWPREMIRACARMLQAI